MMPDGQLKVVPSDEPLRPAPRDLDPRETLVYSIAIEDIERTKKRQFSIAHYGAMVNVALFFLVDYFDKAKLDTGTFYVTVIGVAFTTLIFSIYFQLLLWTDLHKFRKRVHEHSPIAVKSAGAKLFRDLPIAIYLLLIPLGGCLYLTWYAIGKGRLFPGLL